MGSGWRNKLRSEIRFNLDGVLILEVLADGKFYLRSRVPVLANAPAECLVYGDLQFIKDDAPDQGSPFKLALADYLAACDAIRQFSEILELSKPHAETYLR